MSDTPTLPELRAWLTQHHHPEDWTDFLTGLPWHIIKPGVQIAGASKIHPAIALASAAMYTGDQQIRDTIRQHLAGRDLGTGTPDPGPNRATRRAAARTQRKAR